MLLTQLATNLLHNAIRYNHPGGEVTVGVSADRGLTVLSSGPEGARRADRRAVRAVPRRLHDPRTGPADGAGLGLSTVAAIARAHDARPTARPNPDGGLDIAVRPRPLVPA